MKKLLYITVAALTLGFQGIAVANQRPAPQSVSEAFCSSYDENIDSAEQIKRFISELDNPTTDQLITLLAIAEDLENGEDISAVCN